jgi:hypothetical protein
MAYQTNSTEKAYKKQYESQWIYVSNSLQRGNPEMECLTTGDKETLPLGVGLCEAPRRDLTEDLPSNF